MTAGVKTTCPYCGVGCGVLARADGAGAAIAGDPAHPANFGKLCVKGSALGETLGPEGRLLHPMVEGRRASWERAVGHVAQGLRRTLDAYGPGAVAFYLSGQLLTEDYYLANKFAKGFLGVAHVDTNSRLCMASSVAGHRRAFGADVVPGNYEDLDEADLIVLVGANSAWCHPVLHQRMQAAREKRGARIVLIDPRRTASAEDCDLHLPIAQGMDSALFSWLLREIADRGAVDAAYVAAHVSGLEPALQAARRIAPDLAGVAAATGLAAEDVVRFVDWFIAAPRVVTCYSQGVNQSRQGTDKVNAILNCHLATGRIGRTGAGPFSLTGQPNAMGGREVGGLANMLAAHMNYTPADIARVQRFWRAPEMAQAEGLKAVQMFEAIEAGRIKALWVMHTNPAATLPRADAMRRALGKLDLFVVSEALAETDTTLAGAHVLLPAAAWGEKDGTVTNSERRISRQRAFVPAPGEARPDWEHIALVARQMGFSGFGHAAPAEIFREHAALSAYENDGARAFDIGAAADLTDSDYAAMPPFQWPWRRHEAPTARLFANGGFFTPDKRARLIAIADPQPVEGQSAEHPFTLNTGRIRDQWHTMTRTGRAPRLARHRQEPMLSVCPEDARALGLDEGDYARVEGEAGAATLRVTLDVGQRRGAVFAPMHWSGRTGGLARIGAAVHALTDPVSGQPDLKGTPVRLTRLAMASEGFLLSRARIDLPHWLAHARIALGGGELVVFASTSPPAALHGLLSNQLEPARQLVRLADEAAGTHRTLAFDGERLILALAVGACRDDELMEGMTAAFERGLADPGARLAALSGRDGAASGGGPIVCACFGVRAGAIEAAVGAGAENLDAIAERLKAGGNCGSCRPEIRRMLAAPALLGARASSPPALHPAG